ncbi:MAG: DUF1269 domain-containing protein [Bacteroidaceae bacterium]|nr:DUF1269 domain-containing protein [Bacteroidaceae bacterium]
MENVLTVIFNVESEGYQAFTEVQQNLVKELFFVPQMALVKYEQGRLQTLDSYESPVLENGSVFGGGLFGSLLGIIGGPVGMMLCGTTGAVMGMASSYASNEATSSLLENVCSKLDEGTVAIVALTQEENEVCLDSILQKFDTIIIRRSALQVAEEVAEVKQMEEDMQAQLRAQLRAEKKQEFKDKMKKKQEELKADFEAFKAKFRK